MSVGSITMNSLMLRWMDEFKKHHPKVESQSDGKGSSMGPLALTADVADIAVMTRSMRETEIAQFVEKFGYPPTRITVAIDGLVLLVHESNPLVGITLPQVEAVFSSMRQRGHPEDVTLWGQLGLDGEWEERPIVPYARFGWHGHEFFKEQVLAGGEFRASVVEGGGNSLFPPIAVDWRGIIYAPAFLTCQRTRALPLAQKRGASYVEPTYANLVSGDYPLSRWLYIYINRRPGESVSQPLLDFLRFVLSEEAQAIVARQGFGRIPRVLAAEQVLKLGLEAEPVTDVKVVGTRRVP